MSSSIKEAQVAMNSIFKTVLFKIAIYEISNILNTGLDRESLSLLVALCENGVNPDSLSNVVKEIRHDSSTIKEKQIEGK